MFAVESRTRSVDSAEHHMTRATDLMKFSTAYVYPLSLSVIHDCFSDV